MKSKCKFCGANGKDGLYDCWTPMSPVDDTAKIRRTRFCLLREAVQKHIDALAAQDYKASAKWFVKMEKMSGRFSPNNQVPIK